MASKIRYKINIYIVTKSLTLNDLARRNGHLCVFSSKARFVNATRAISTVAELLA